MDDNYECYSQRLKIMSLNKKISPTKRRHNHILFNFICETAFLDWLREDSTTPAVFVGREEHDTTQASTAAIMSDRADPDIRGVLENVLAPIWSGSNGIREWVIKFAQKEARKILSTNTSTYVSVDLELRVRVEHNHVYYMDRGSGGAFMVPAVDSSIRLLKRYEVCSGSSVVAERCAICLEDFSGREEDFSGRGEGFAGREALLCMPCDHVFHGECIKKWLRMSHYCPLCRYEMPIN